MGQKGIVVMLNELTGHGRQETMATLEASFGKTIKAIALEHLDPDELRIWFTDGTAIKVLDDGQSCCEQRYMTTDDDLSSFVGATLTDMEIADGPEIEEEYEAHEVQFLVVQTSLGAFTMETHNEHNGYYGGFYLIVKPLDAD